MHIWNAYILKQTMSNCQREAIYTILSHSKLKGKDTALMKGEIFRTTQNTKSCGFVDTKFTTLVTCDAEGEYWGNSQSCHHVSWSLQVQINEPVSGKYKVRLPIIDPL